MHKSRVTTGFSLSSKVKWVKLAYYWVKGVCRNFADPSCGSITDAVDERRVAIGARVLRIGRRCGKQSIEAYAASAPPGTAFLCAGWFVCRIFLRRRRFFV